MNVIVFASRKGGSGKSTLTAHIAAHAQKSSRPCLLIDADPQGSLTLWHGVRGTGEPVLRTAQRSVSEILKSKRVFVLKEEVGTLPRFFYYFDERYPNTLDPEALAIAERLRAEEGETYGRLPGAAGPDKNAVAAAEPAWWNGAHA